MLIVEITALTTEGETSMRMSELGPFQQICISPFACLESYEKI
jgi:hypothetical protein